MRLRRTDAIYLLAVGVLALVFALDVVSRAVGPDTSGATATGGAGRARDVDMERLRRLLRQGYLSDHEALYYRPCDPEAPP